MNNNLFSAQATTFALTAGTVASTPVQMSFRGNSIRIVNEGPNVAFVAISPAATSATVPGALPGTTSCTPVLPGSDVTLGMCNNLNFISAICRAAGSAVLSVTVGEGM